MTSTGALLTLSTAPHRRPITVRRLAATEPTAVRRMAELGLTPGATVEVLNRSSSALIISTRNSRVAIGLPLAASVLVEVSE